MWPEMIQQLRMRFEAGKKQGRVRFETVEKKYRLLNLKTALDSSIQPAFN